MILSSLCILGAASAAAAHEFWIDPLHYQIAPEARIEAKFRNGENFAGVELAFFDRRSARLQIAFDEQLVDVLPRNGDRPAVVVEPLGQGLHAVLHETKPSSLTYKTWEKFAKFATHKDFDGIEAQHQARGLPREGFKEQYSRHAKALIAVGTSDGADKEYGLATEITALTNPYTPNFDQVMQVYVSYQGVKRSDVQVEIFEKAPDGSVNVSLTRTDMQGLAQIKTQPGHAYLIDSVVIAETPAGSDYAWRTFWAALTFSVPAE